MIIKSEPRQLTMRICCPTAAGWRGFGMRADAEILGDWYHGKITLPQIPMYQYTGHTSPGPFSHAQAIAQTR